MSCRTFAAATLLAALMLLSPLARADEFDAQSLQNVANSVAADLLRGIKAVGGGGPLKLAVRPFPSDVIVDRDAVVPLYNAMERALKEQGGGEITIVERALLDPVWREAREFQVNPTIEGMLKDAGADILVMGELLPAADGYLLSYTADDLRPDHLGTKVGLMREPHVLPPSFGATKCLSLDDAIRAAAIDTAEDIAAASPGETRSPDLRPGDEETDFRRFVRDHFIENVLHLWPAAARRHAGTQPVGTATATPAPLPQTTLRLTVYSLGKCVDIGFAGESQGGKAFTPVTKRASLESISAADLLPLNPQCGKGQQRASGEALVGKQLDRDAARLGAQWLARARAITDEGCVVFSGPGLIRDPADMQWALKAISGGLITGEHWDYTELDNGARVRATLSATIKKLGGEGVPTVRAALSATPVQSKVPFTLTLTADAPAFVAVFDWQSDDHVLLIYPYPRERSMSIAANRELKLPRSGDYPLTTEPRPGLATDFEALIVVASAKPLDYPKLAPEPADTVAESMKRAVPVAKLFEALAAAGVPLTLTVVPYQIVPKS